MKFSNFLFVLVLNVHKKHVMFTIEIVDEIIQFIDIINFVKK